MHTVKLVGAQRYAIQDKLFIAGKSYVVSDTLAATLLDSCDAEGKEYFAKGATENGGAKSKNRDDNDSAGTDTDKAAPLAKKGEHPSQKKGKHDKEKSEKGKRHAPHKANIVQAKV